ncbi:hypothetical protein NKH57_28135 [Mesorhizobium sp. M1050]|uniref:hypothetical protein n=1 Tax=Mesorhizobium sp. M1050 TaxID=2957051 RepID=UPI0033355499
MSGFRSVLSWLIGRPLLIWIGLVLPVLLLLVTTRLFHSDLTVRSSGFALQLFGLVAAYCGLSGVVKELVDQGPVAPIFHWVVLGGETALFHDKMLWSPPRASARQLPSVPPKSGKMNPDATLEMRMEHVERSIEALRDNYGR